MKNTSNKALNLINLKSHGYKVPDFIVVNIDLDSYEKDICNNYELIHDKLFKSDIIILRPSLPIEDSKLYSFAGLMNSVIYKKNEFTIDLLRKEIDNCKAHINDGHIQDYCEKHNIRTDFELNNISLIVQKFINGSPSGVVFTQNPVGTSDELIIESTFGHNTTITSGLITPDIIIVQRDTMEIKKEIIGTKKKICSFDNTIHSIDNNFDLGKSLTEEQIFELARTSLQIEKLFSCPQDIEWIYDNKDLYILQTRPITRY